MQRAPPAAGCYLPEEAVQESRVLSGVLIMPPRASAPRLLSSEEYGFRNMAGWEHFSTSGVFVNLTASARFQWCKIRSGPEGKTNAPSSPPISISANARRAATSEQGNSSAIE